MFCEILVVTNGIAKSAPLLTINEACKLAQKGSLFGVECVVMGDDTKLFTYQFGERVK